METQCKRKPFAMFNRSAALFAVMVCCLLGTFTVSAAPLTISVVGVGADGNSLPAAVADYRWTVEEDATKASIPGAPATSANYSFSMHTSYMPVVAAGRVGAALGIPPTQDPDVLRLYNQTLPDLDPSKRYYVSIAAEGYQMGGAPVVFSNGGATATVYVNQYALPTAQLSVFAFNDNNPINGAPDLPVETGLAGFTVQLLEAGGTYGQSGGAVTQDAFANPLGTTYNADGSVNVRGSGIILTGADGTATISNLFPAKYTVVIVPPVGSDWHQTSTIEGGYGQDAWIKNNEPTFFQEFGPPGHHVFIGFTRSGFIARNNGAPVLNGSRKITGRIVNTHNSRPPVYTFSNAAPVNACWVGLNAANAGQALYATACKKDSTFEIPNVPNGIYELVVWDEPLDMIIGTTTVTVNNADLALGDVPVSSWFGRYQGRVFQDIDGTGLPFFKEAFDRPYIAVDPVTGLETETTKSFQAGELKPPFGEGVASNIRFRDGSIYQSMVTKTDGTFAFTEVFPFFNFMIAEIDYARFKATSATVVVDDGGAVDPVANKTKLWNAAPGLYGSNDPALAYDPWTRLNPQFQPESGKYYRTESVEGGPGAVLLEAMQTFLSQTNHIEWGKVPYKIDENGGIAGIVHYAITRAEDDPRFAAAENWEPGIPRVQVNLFLDCDADGRPDQPKNDGSGQCSEGGLSAANGYAYDQPDVDNYPFCWRDPASCGLGATQRGPEDQKRSHTGDANTFSYGDVFRWGGPGQAADQQPEIGLGKTDSWDDSIPTGCPDLTPYTVPSTGEQLDCFDGLRNFNQVRPAVFDGGYAFGRVAGQAELPMIIGAAGEGTYIIEAVAPPGYLHQGNGDKNVVFGDTLKASVAALPFECVGMELAVPAELTLFPGEPNPNYTGPGQTWRKCDMKAVPLVPGTNPAPDFYMFTEAPVAGHGVGFILDDTSSEFNRFAPNFGEKYSPPHLPISIQDWTGREISRVYSDQFGSYNFLVPSSFTINPPFPSGVMPSMMVACMNHPGPIADPNDPTKTVIDPYFNRKYTQFCYTLQYLAGKTTYLDTPVLPIAAFAAVDKNPLDCECAEGTPGIYSATNGDNGPWVPGAGTPLTIVSMGRMDVANPAFDPAEMQDPTPGAPINPKTLKTIKRDYGFGTVAGTVTLNGVALTGVTWADGVITATVPSGASTGQLMIKRGDNAKESVVGLTVHVGGPAPKKVNLAGTNGAYKTIQAAIEAAGAGDLISIAPGTYNEYVIMDKRVRLQGWGAGSVAINAAKSSAGGLAAWRARINAKAGTTFTLLDGQTLGIDAANNEPLLFGAEEGPGVLVVGRSGSNNGCDGAQALRIDGLTVTGSDSGGGILASGYACNLQVSNNRVVANYGTYGGGIRIGHTALLAGDNTFTDGVNRTPNIHHNWISQNGATEAGGGGGITLGTGSNSYVVERNYVCGNFSMADGGGLSHLGRSPGSVSSTSSPANRISSNMFIFNQTFNQSADPMGGGLSIAGQVPVGGGSSTGTGDVRVDANLIKGNQAGAGAGGGVSIARTALTLFGGDDNVVLTNNMIVNNVAAYAGGGVSMTGVSLGVELVNNTVASNVSTASNRQSFGPSGPAAPSLPQIAGIALLDGTTPILLNNIIWANRSYIYLIEGTTSGLYNPGTASIASPNPAPSYSDLGRVAPGFLALPRYSVLTDTTANRTAYDTGLSGCTNTLPLFGFGVGCNRFAAPSDASLFVKASEFASVIDPTQPVVLFGPTVYLQSALTFDETGNFINVIFSPLTLWETTPGPSFGAMRSDYHIPAGSIVRDNGRNRGLDITIGANLVPTADIDADARTGAVDIGADEFVAPVVPPPSKPTLGVLDNFNRGNANTLGANWQQLALLGNAGIHVNANQALCTGALCGTSANAYWNATVFGAKQAAAVTFANTTLNGEALFLKASGNFTLGSYQNAIRVRYSTGSGGQVIVETTTNTGLTYTAAGTLPGSFAGSDTLTALADASGAVFVWKTTGATTTYVGQVATGATFAGTGRVGLSMVTNGRVDNFSGGTVP